MPSLMARMLELLEVEEGNMVLEIGTGSGYNAALLCERLGSEHVTSIDIQADLVEEARGRLAELGYHPQLAVADGVGGYPERAPYDRIICTGMAWPIPTAWLEQVRPGGRIVTVVPEGCVALERHREGTTSGRYDRESYRFTPIQPWPVADPQRLLASFQRGSSQRDRPPLRARGRRQWGAIVSDHDRGTRGTVLPGLRGWRGSLLMGPGGRLLGPLREREHDHPPGRPPAALGPGRVAVRALVPAGGAQPRALRADGDPGRGAHALARPAWLRAPLGGAQRAPEPAGPSRGGWPSIRRPRSKTV
jgi:protein-L-isoaspartate O-methyltransferase